MNTLRTVIKRKILTFLIFGVMAGVFSPVYSDGLPGEYIVTQRWRDLFAGVSPLSNPAFLTEENYITLRAAFAPIMENAFKLWEVGVTVPVGMYQSAGFTWVGEDDGQIEQYKVSQERLKPSGEYYEMQNNFFMLSYAINPWKRLSAGASVTVAHQTNFGDPKLGLGLDLGLSYRLFRHAILGDHVAGILFQNLLSPKPNIDVTNSYAMNMKLSWMARFWEGRIESGIDLDVKDLFAKGEDFLKKVESNVVDNGMSVDSILYIKGDKNLEVDFNYRIGFWALRVLNAYFQIGNDYWGIVGGLNVPSVNNGRDFSVMYQYMSMLDSEKASGHTIYFRSELGKHREEIYARKMARMASVMPNELYNKALRLYTAGKYWDAFFVFGEIVAKFPDFFKNDWVQYYRGSCMEELDMRGEALKHYETAKEKYPRSNAIEYADLGIMRVQYRNDNNASVTQQFKQLNRDNVSDSLKYHAFYLMGETHMKTENYKQAIELFSIIPESHPEYIFAQHSLAICHVFDLNLEQAMFSLENCLQARLTNKAQEEVYARSCVLLGYLFYEGNSLSKAVTALRMVPQDSYYYQDAELGLAWCALKARQWIDCVQASETLLKITKHPEIRAEATLLKAYGLLMQKKYDQSELLLENAIQTVEDIESPSLITLADRREEYQQTRQQYDALAEDATRMSLVDPSSAAIRIIDSLHTEQRDDHGQIEEFLAYADEFERRRFFARNMEKVREDIEYAYAVVQKIMNRESGLKENQKIMQEQQDINEELKKLEEEMNKLEEQDE
ncbi:MAG: tetratricopeptide repeat protein [Fibrobacterota bacterium]